MPLAAHQPVTVSARDLRHLVSGGSPVHLLDVRWTLGAGACRADYLAEHLPGAVFVDLDEELSRHGEPIDGRHPLPDVEDLQASARAWGLRRLETVVVYDDSANLASARAWWLLRWAGLVDVRLLDGGLGAWREQGFETEQGEVVAEPGDVVLAPGHLPTLDADTAAAYPLTGALLDARARERYLGESEPIDPRAGHIPGALNAPTAENVDSAGRFKKPAELRARFAELGVRPGGAVAVYCGSGVTAAHEIAALALAGIPAALYPGSWSAWSNDPGRPVALGEHA